VRYTCLKGRGSNKLLSLYEPATIVSHVTPYQECACIAAHIIKYTGHYNIHHHFNKSMNISSAVVFPLSRSFWAGGAHECALSDLLGHEFVAIMRNTQLGSWGIFG